MASVCHCRACQRRTGRPFAAQARLPASRLSIQGNYRIWERVAESGRKAWYRWCPACGGTVADANEGMDDMLAIPIGAFASEELRCATVSVFEERMQTWIAITGEGIEHID